MYNEANTSYIIYILCYISGFAKTVMSAAFVRLTVLTQLTSKNHGSRLNNLVYLEFIRSP